MTTQAINLRDAEDGHITTVEISVPDERYPDDLKQLAPIVSWEGALYLLKDAGFRYGASVTPEYVRVEPVVATAKP